MLFWLSLAVYAGVAVLNPRPITLYFLVVYVVGYYFVRRALEKGDAAKQEEDLEEYEEDGWDDESMSCDEPEYNYQNTLGEGFDV